MARLHDSFETLSPSHQRLGRLVLDEPERCAFMTIGEMADEVSVNVATVTRFANAVCGGGYPSLVALCRERLQNQAQLLERFKDLEVMNDTDLMGSLVAGEQANLATTFASIDPTSWEKATVLLAEARTIYVVGMRKTFSTAYMLSYLLGLIRGNVHQLTGTAGTTPERLRNIDAGDVCVAMSIRRYTRETLRVMEFARKKGATTIALTDSQASPLARSADYPFIVATESVGILRSLAAVMSLVQAMATAVARRLGTDTRSALLLEEELLAEFDVYEIGP